MTGDQRRGNAGTEFMPRWLLIVALSMMLAACSSASLEGAGEGALGGAAAGAVGGMISAAIFGGNVGDAAARGAAWGASVGAVSRAVHGASAESNRQQRETDREQTQIQAEIARVRQQIGEDAFTSLERLVDGKHDPALTYARVAQRSENEESALAGLWLEALAYYDSARPNEASALLPRLVESEPTLGSEEDAGIILADLHEGLLEIRDAFGIPR